MEHFTVKELKQIAEAQHLLDSMEEIGPERRRELVAIVRALAELAREIRLSPSERAKRCPNRVGF